MSAALKESARKTRTLYVREEDQEVWDQARDILGDLSPYVTKHLRTVVASHKTSQQGFERIVLNFIKDTLPQAVAFHGRWLISPEQPYETETEEGCPDYYSCALTAKGKLAVFNTWGSKYDPTDFEPAMFLVFDSFEQLGRSSKVPQYFTVELMKQQGIEVQELDI